MKFMRRCAPSSGTTGKLDYLFWDGGWLAQRGSDRDAAFFWEPGKYRDPKNAWPVAPENSDTDKRPAARPDGHRPEILAESHLQRPLRLDWRFRLREKAARQPPGRCAPIPGKNALT